VRERPEFLVRHIINAASCPALLLRQDKMPRVLARLRTRPEIAVVLYDDKEDDAPAVAHMLITRGFLNVKVLSGGLFHLGERYPILIDGEPLPDMSPPRTSGRASRKKPSGAEATIARDAEDRSPREDALLEERLRVFRPEYVDPTAEAIRSRATVIARGVAGRSGSAAAVAMGMDSTVSSYRENVGPHR
jgi:rhodanese-related sulfurtransferase